MEVDGEAGLRGTYANVKGAGLLTLNVIRISCAFDPLNFNAAADITTRVFRQNMTAKATIWDWLPTGNLDVRAFRTLMLCACIGKTAAWSRPGQSRLGQRPRLYA